jgi:hypothetical protein
MLSLKRRPRKAPENIEPRQIKKVYASKKERFEKKYSDSLVRFEYKESPRIKKYFGIFSVRIIPRKNTTQVEWDEIRRRRFSNVIRTLYDAGFTNLCPRRTD